MRFDIAFGRITPLLIATGMPQSTAYLDIGDTTLDVRMGWSFKASIPLASITTVEALDRKAISIGVHGWNGRWLVNGRSDQLVQITIDPAVKAKAVLYPIKLRELTVSVDNRDEFVRVLQAR